MTLDAHVQCLRRFQGRRLRCSRNRLELYDTIYTERYMGRPQDNPEGYRDSSPVNQAGNLHGKLMMVHGTGDDNVHFANSVELLNAHD